ncbi:hypothetical protein H0H92_005811 [Tricholoma furcatifolium]|nr:hypothetical protein H0H92_005811 [Tricholoma furcatifolium]
MDSLYTQWVQQQPQLLPDQHDSDWSKDRSTQSTTAESSLAAAAALDIADFALNDISGATPAKSLPSTSNAPLSPPTQSFFPYQTTHAHGYFVQAPYNTMAYGASSWQPQTHVPLSNYSSLNGATTSATPSTSTSSTPQQQQHSPPASSPPQMAVQQPKQPSQPQSQLQQALMIDPALTTLNGSTSRSTSNLQHYPQANYNSSPSSSLQNAPQPQPQQLQTLTPQQYTYPAQSYYRTAYYPSQQQSQQQQQQAPQGTLSPQALHAPSSSILTALTPSSFYGHPPLHTDPSSSSSHPQSHPQVPLATFSLQTQEPPAPAPPTKTPEELKAEFLAKLRPQLQSTSFTGAGAVNLLSNTIAEYGTSEVDATTRLEILTKMRDGAGNHYFRAWSENAMAMTVTREWLRAAQAAEGETPLVETIMPLLHIIDRLPMTLDTLKSSKLGKIVVKLVKEPRSPDLKSSKKRKIADPPRGAAPPPKKAVLGNSATGTTSSKPVVVKKESSSGPTGGAAGMGSGTAAAGAGAAKPAAKDAKSDSSFFSAPKPKPKLPSFKKAPPAPLATKAGGGGAAQPPPANVAQPSSVNPFEEALKSMGRSTRRESPAVATPPAGAGAADTPPPQVGNGTGLSKKGTKKKSVTWPSDDKLVKVKVIERAVYEDDPVDGVHTAHTAKDLDRGEGAALHTHLFEEAIDWSEPLLVDNLIAEDDRPRGSRSEEKLAQEKREQTVLGALYMSPTHVPDSPAEPPHVISDEETDREVVTMTSGPEVDTVFWSSAPVAPVIPPTQSVAELVGQLTGGGADSMPFGGQGLDLTSTAMDPQTALAALPQEQIQRLLMQLQPQLNAGLFPETGQTSTQAMRGELLIIRTMVNSSRFKTPTQILVGEVGDVEEDGEEDGEEVIMEGIETIHDDYPALFLRQEGERILQWFPK